MTSLIWSRVKQEISQEYPLRKRLFSKISKHFEDRYVVSFYTNFRSNAPIGDSDSEMLGTLLSGSKKAIENKILLIINSPGGDPLAAEKIIKVLSEYSDNDYWVLVPRMSKSAATMICLGSKKIILSPISELGPIDLQISLGDKLIPAYSIINAYDNLIEKGINLEEGQRIEPILQQLQSFDAAEIELFRQVNELSSDIAKKVLRRGMFKDVNEKEIDSLIKIFIDPGESKVHSRPIYYSDIKEIDISNNFNLELINSDENIWKTISEYHIRIVNNLDVTNTSKILESEDGAYHAGGN